jgi:hypothetical protein
LKEATVDHEHDWERISELDGQNLDRFRCKTEGCGLFGYRQWPSVPSKDRTKSVPAKRPLAPIIVHTEVKQRKLKKQYEGVRSVVASTSDEDRNRDDTPASRVGPAARR